MDHPSIYGLVAEFNDEATLKSAAHSAHLAGYKRLDAYAPFPVEGLAESLGITSNGVPALVLLGGILGCITGFAMQWYAAVISYPINVGGKPLNSWPSFIPITFELTILGAALFAVFGMLALNGLPMPYHPLFHIASFSQASKDKFFLCIEARDPMFERSNTWQFLETLDPTAISEVPL